MNQYSVLLQHPHWDDLETTFSHVSAHNVEGAIQQARMECVRDNPHDHLDPEDVYVLLVIEGWHNDVKP